jgi:hypothetical protein
LVFRFRPLRRHQRLIELDGERVRLWEAACKLLAEFFEAVGGFSVGTDAAVTAWADLLASGDFSPEEIRWAIASKAASLAGGTAEECRAKRIYRGRPESFTRNLAYWLELSPAYQAQVERVRVAGQRCRTEALRATRDAAARRSLDDFASGAAGRAASHAAALHAAESRRAAFWAGLSDQQRAAALTATRSAFLGACERWGLAAESLEAELSRRDFAVNWAMLKWPPGHGNSAARARACDKLGCGAACARFAAPSCLTDGELAGHSGPASNGLLCGFEDRLVKV